MKNMSKTNPEAYEKQAKKQQPFSKEYRNRAKDGTHRRDAPIGEIAPGCAKKQERHDFIVFPHPHRGDGTGCDLSDVYPRLGATATTFELYEVPYAVGSFDMR